MAWSIENTGGAVVVKMNSNSVGTINDGFVDDLNAAFSSLRKNSPGKSVVLSSAGKMFSPGLDLGQCVALFRKGNKQEIERWFEGFLNAMLTVFEHPAPVAAAIEGHAIAGGCILALCCDVRVAEEGKKFLGLNETSIGFPMPHSLTALVKGILGNKNGTKVIDEGKLHDVRHAVENGIVNTVAETGNAVSEALKQVENMNSEFFIAEKKKRNGKISAHVRICFSNEDSKNLFSKLSSNETVGKLEALLETMKKGGK